MNSESMVGRAWGGVCIFLVIFLLGACESMSHEEEGEIIGGVLGGVLGAQIGDGRGRTAAIIVGTLAGSMIGRHIGETMDDVDRSNIANALHDNPSHVKSTWINPDTGHAYEVTPTRTYTTQAYPCREFNLLATIDGHENQPVRGVACLREDGVWELQRR